MMNLTKMDRLFSEYVRLRDSKDGLVRCISCNKIVPWKLSDCGHYINRKHLSTRFDEQNCNAQCRSCNRFDEGNMQGYRKGLIKKYGEKSVDMLELKKFNTCKLTSFEIEILIKLYKSKLKQLDEQKKRTVVA